jgi:predicted small integral membrane protein
MRLFMRLGNLRAALTVLTAIVGIYMTLVVLNNVTDFSTNRAFVDHVLAMDTTFRSPNTMWRAIASPGVAIAVYVVIIAWEAITAAALIAAGISWAQSLADDRKVVTARHFSTIGWLMMLALFGGGFITIGGEWFEMWQSSKWNGLQPAIHNFAIAMAGLIVTYLPHKAGSDIKD